MKVVFRPSFSLYFGKLVCVYLWHEVWAVLHDTLQPMKEEAHLSEGQEPRKVGLLHLYCLLAHMNHLHKMVGGATVHSLVPVLCCNEERREI